MKYRLMAALAAVVLIGGGLATPAEAAAHGKQINPNRLTPKLCATYNTANTTAVFTKKRGLKTCTRTTVETLADDPYIQFTDDLSVDFYMGVIHYEYVETDVYFFTQRGRGPIEDNLGTLSRTNARETERLCKFTHVDPETGAQSNPVDVPISECASRGLYGSGS